MLLYFKKHIASNQEIFSKHYSALLLKNVRQLVSTSITSIVGNQTHTVLLKVLGTYLICLERVKSCIFWMFCFQNYMQISSRIPGSTIVLHSSKAIFQK